MKRLEDWANLVLGIWLLFVPSIFGLTTSAAWTTYAVGTLVTIDSLWAMGAPESKTPEWFNILIGAFYFVSPGLYGYTDVPSAAWTAWLVGTALTLLAVLALPKEEADHAEKHASSH